MRIAGRRQGVICSLLLTFQTCTLLVWLKTRSLRQTPVPSISVDAPSQDDPDRPEIPQVIHQTFSHSRVFKLYRPFIESCLRLNPDWTYMLWTDKEIRMLIDSRYPKLSGTFKQLTNKLVIADIARDLVLHAFGGVYLDMDIECKAPLWPAVANVSAFLGQEPQLQARILHNFELLASNAIMGSVPGHPFFGQLVAHLEQKKHPEAFANVLETTGPLALTRELIKYWQSPQNRSHPVTLAPSHVFMPEMDENEAKKWPRLCANNPTQDSPRSRGCLQAKLLSWVAPRNFQSQTIGVHHWVHLTQFGQAQERTDILEQFKGRVFMFTGAAVAKVN